MTVMTCKGTTRDGKPCNATPRPGSEWCPWHDPELTQRRSEWSAKGGKNSSSKARAAKELPAVSLSNDEVHAWLSLAFRKTLAGQMEPRVLNALSAAANALTDLGRAVEQDQVINDLAAKITKLERRGA